MEKDLGFDDGAILSLMVEEARNVEDDLGGVDRY